ncbi:hypothetical protein G7046_g3043 [Stylonectria norvegica]|nr:hypothetical protein G7046_g3043 [Stylonectria norvegica]
MLRRALNLRLALNAIAIKVSANLVVQFLARRRPGEHPPFDWQQVIEFAFYGGLGSQIGNIVQFILEDWFPTGNPQGTEVLPDSRILGDDRQLEEKKDDDSIARGRGGRWRWLRISPDIIWRNVLAKLILDQTIGLVISGSVFLICTNIMRVPHPLMVFLVIRDRIWTLMRAGWHIWPLVAVCNFLWVPVRSRVLVAVFVGFGWSIFLSIFAMRK